MERQTLAPWLKYLWEAHRTILETVRHYVKLEPFYHVCLLCLCGLSAGRDAIDRQAAIQQALQFCREFKRRLEFRHLCDILRAHSKKQRQHTTDVHHESVQVC